MKSVDNAGNQAFFHKIILRNGIYPSADPISVLMWNGMTFQQYCKWKWYFTYRAALLQVQNPKLLVQQFWGPYQPDQRTERNNLENRIINKKARITSIKRKMEAAKCNWKELFPIESEPFWKDALSKLKEKESELEQLESDLIKVKP